MGRAKVKFMLIAIGIIILLNVFFAIMHLIMADWKNFISDLFDIIMFTLIAIPFVKEYFK